MKKIILFSLILLLIFTNIASANTSVVTPDGTKKYISSWGLDYIRVVDPSTGEVLSTLGIGTLDYGIAVCPDGSKLYVADAYGSYYNQVPRTDIYVIDTKTNTCLDCISFNSTKYLRDLAISCDGSRLFASCNGKVWVIDTNSKSVIACIDIPYSFPDDQDLPGEMLYVSPDGKTLYAGIYPIDISPYLPPAQIPEFPTVTIPIAAILGIIAITGRKKR